MADTEASYIDYEAFLSPTFSPIAFANTLVTATNNASDTPLDLSTPLSRVLFDVQEIDTHIHNLTTRSALPLLEHTKDRAESSQRLASSLETQTATLTESYQRLEAEVINRHAVAAEVHQTVTNLWQTVKLGRAVARCLLLGRQLEAQMAEYKASASSSTAAPSKKEDHKAQLRAAATLLTLRALFAASGPNQEGHNLPAITVLQTLNTDLLTPSETRLRTSAQQTVREFSLSSLAPPSTNLSNPGNPAPTPQTYTQSEETKARTTTACLTLYLLSQIPSPTPSQSSSSAQIPHLPPILLLTALQTYLQTALTSSLASLARALATLPSLPRALTETAARCQNISALEILLASIPTPTHPALSPPSDALPLNLLAPLLQALDTTSLPSFFWRSLASALSGRVAEILNRGGVSARMLRSQKERIRESIREAVLKGVEGARGEGWEREVGVMVASVVGGLGR